MSIFVAIREAKSYLSSLVNAMLAGDDVIIVRDGVLIARLVPVRPERVPGTARGLIQTSANIDAPLPDSVLKAFEPV